MMGLKGLAIVPAALGAGLVLAACGSSNNGIHGNAALNNASGAATVLSAPATVTEATPAGGAATASPIVMPAAGPSRSPAAAAGPAGLGKPATNPVERLSGTVQSVAAGKVTLKDGNSFALAPQTVVTKRAPITVGDLKVGQTVAITAKRQPDNT